MKLGERIKKARHEAGLTQEQLAERLGNERTRIIDWEKGRYAPSRKYRKRLSEALGHPEEYFEGQREDKTLEARVKDILDKRLAELGFVEHAA